MKTRQCIFIEYDHDEYGYRMYDLVEKKLVVKSRDVQFMEDQTIEDIDKVKKSTPKKDNNLSEIDSVRMPVHDLDTIDNNVQNGEQHNYDGEEPECYQKSMESEERQKAWQSKLSKHFDLRYHWIRDALDAKLLELAKVHTDDNGC
ncbi:hypothetical protein CR513_51640, partial [Mucuna pruriens]